MMLKVSTGYQSSDQVGEKESVKVLRDSNSISITR